MTLQFGFLGLGFMAATHIQALAHVPGTAVGAICNPSGRNLDGDLTRVGGNVGDPNGVRLDMTQVRAYRDVSEFLADPSIHVVDITTPTKTHVELAIAALKAGKHVLVEKPMTRTAEEGRRLAAAAREAAARGVFLMPAMCLRFWPEWQAAHDAIVGGHYGRVLSARFRRVAQAPGWGHGHFLSAADSGGALLDLHIHDVDFIRHCFGHASDDIYCLKAGGKGVHGGGITTNQAKAFGKITVQDCVAYTRTTGFKMGQQSTVSGEDFTCKELYVIAARNGVTFALFDGPAVFKKIRIDQIHLDQKSIVPLQTIIKKGGQVKDLSVSNVFCEMQPVPIRLPKEEK